jgi:pimeloyl-ACP methyl ester carboxylesterase
MATFCLLHGNWHDGSCWDRLPPALAKRGHRALTPDLPLEDAATTWEERVRPALLALEDADGPVVVVGHSAASGYAAILAARGPAHLLVYLCPRLAEFDHPPGEPQVFRETLTLPPRRDDGALVWEPEDAMRQMYPRLEPEAARALAARLRPSAPPAGEFPLEGPPDLPTALVYAAEDEFFEPEYERFIASELLEVEPIEIPGGHFPRAEDPEQLAELFDRLAS